MKCSKKSLKTIIIILLFTLFVGSYIILQGGEQSGGERESKSYGVWQMPPVILEMLALEFKGLFADYLVLEAGAKIGTSVIRDEEGFKVEDKEIDWDAVHKMFVSSQYLDPTFLQTFFLAQGWLPWEDVGMVGKTQQILQVTAQNRPWDWQPYRTMAFNEYYFNNDLVLASEYFLKAAKAPNAPPFLGIVGSRLAQKSGETTVAIAIVRSTLSGMNDDDSGYRDLLDRLEALLGVQELEKAVESFQKRFSRLPYSLDEIVNSGIVPSLPKNPYNVGYCIDRAGKLYFDNLDCTK